jgi:hypothetical protein
MQECPKLRLHDKSLQTSRPDGNDRQLWGSPQADRLYKIKNIEGHHDDQAARPARW